jgi:hypothetical protein
MLLLPLLALWPLFLRGVAASNGTLPQLVALAAAGRGAIKLDSTTFDVLTGANRSWSASVVFTSLDPRNGCEPCRSVFIAYRFCSA